MTGCWRVDEQVGNTYETTWCTTEAEAIAVKLAIVTAKRAAKPAAHQHLPIVGVEMWQDWAVYVPTERGRA